MSKIVIIIILLILKIDLLFSQNIDGEFASMNNCNIKIIYKRNDSIFCIGDGLCYKFNIDTTIDGVWIIYSAKDTTTIFQKLRIRNGLKSGKGYFNCPLGIFEMNYFKGILNGPYISYSTNGHIISFYNYYMGKRIENSYHYYYDKNDEIKCIEIYNKKGRFKKKINIIKD